MTSQTLQDIPIRQLFRCQKGRQTFGAVREDDNRVFVYNSHSRTYGRRLDNNQFLSLYDLLAYKAPDENAAWHRRIHIAIKRLENSGLWPENIPYL